MDKKIFILIAVGIYIFVVFLTYFIACLFNDDDEEDNIGLAICWPLLIILFIIYLPFWTMRKAAEYVKRYKSGE